MDKVKNQNIITSAKDIMSVWNLFPPQAGLMLLSDFGEIVTLELLTLPSDDTKSELKISDAKSGKGQRSIHASEKGGGTTL